MYNKKFTCVVIFTDGLKKMIGGLNNECTIKKNAFVVIFTDELKKKRDYKCI